MPARAPVRRRAAAPKRPTAIVNLQDEAYRSTFNWLLYGGSGVGKSVLAGTAPKALFLGAEPEGAESARARGSKADHLDVGTWQDFLDVTAWMEASGHKEYEWACIDGWTELEEHAWNAIMAGGKLPRSVAGGFRQRSRNDYPLVWSAVYEQIARWNRMPINIVHTAQTMRVDVETDEGEDTTLALPLVGSTKRGDLAMKVCGQMTLVGYYRHIRDPETGKRRRRLHTQDGERWVAKDRHDTFGAYVDNPTVPGMAQRIQERLATRGPLLPARKRRARTARTEEQ